jgi:deazaflavin-dependent oxidoreductase (nitroreductase family)
MERDAQVEGNLPAELIKQLSELEEIDLETVGRRSGQPRRATMWVAVADGVPYVRSEHAEKGQWYQNAIAEPRVAIVIDGARHEALASQVTDANVLRRVSDALAKKYAHHGSVDVMLGPNVEPTTLRLSPR